MLHFESVPGPLKDLLLDLAPRLALRDFALGGGTSLALRFGHRLSVDLDFFTSREFVTGDLFEDLEIHGATVMARSANSLSVDVDGIKLDLLRHGYAWLEPHERIGGVALVSLPDLVAMKLNAIANRGAKKDFHDVAALLDQFPLEQMLGFFERKYPSADIFTVVRSLSWFEDAEMEPDPVSFVGLGWEQVKRKVRHEVAGLK